MNDYSESAEINSDMARAQLMKIANYGKTMFNSLNPDDQLPDWVKSKITAASEHMGAVKHWMDYEMKGDTPLAKRGTEIRPGKVGKVMREFKEGRLYSSSGDKVTERKQAIAIAMSEAGMSRKMAKGGLTGNSDVEINDYSKDFGCLSWFTGTSLCYTTMGYRLTVPQVKAKSDRFIGRIQTEFYQKMYYEKMDSPKSWEAIKSQMLEYAEKHRGDKIKLRFEDGGKILSNKEIIKDLEFEDQTDRKHGMYSFSFHTQDSEGAIILDYDGNIVVAPAESRAPDELDWGQNVPEDWENAEDYIFDKFYEWRWSKNKKMADGGKIGESAAYITTRKKKYVLVDPMTNNLWANEYFISEKEAIDFASQNNINLVSNLDAYDIGMEDKEQESDYPFVVEVMYRDGANYKDFYTFGISEEQANAIAIGDEWKSDLFGISEKMWYDEYLPGDYNPEYDHNTLEVKIVRPRKETDVLSNK